MVQSKTELFEKELTEIADIFKALSHPARLRILQFLSETKTCITGDISDELPLGRTTVNQHLKELKDLGLIKGETEGVKVNYCLNETTIRKVESQLSDFLANLKTCDSSNQSCNS
ncbi:MAG TPA: metalloregulator ArsR/SmtB family transcription factor [Draconibacterium sp.]|jgi:ArsR family transcriptional regulator, arsenate/arsenite/antimonite-responsive transcriptional repressor|nr:metalloregulator ArsR/SmtB family transcription factor [Draconibacterium sp.]